MKIEVIMIQWLDELIEEQMWNLLENSEENVYGSFMSVFHLFSL